MQKNLVKIMIIALIVIMILVSVIGTILIVATDIFESKDVLFKRYISQNISAISNILDFSAEEDLAKNLKQKDYKTTTTGTLKYLEADNDEEEIYDIELASIANNSDENIYGKIKLNYDKYTLTDVELLKEGEIYGIYMPNLFNTYISIKNESLPYVVSSLGFDDKYISEELHINIVDFLEVLKFTDEEIASLQKSYENAIFSGISKQAFSSKRDVLITLKNGQSLSTTAYTLALTQNDLDKVYKRVLNHTAENKIILQKVELLEQKLKDAGLNTAGLKQELKDKGLNITGDESFKDIFVSYLTEKSNNIEYAGANERITTFTVYREGNQTVRTAIKNENSEIIIDLSSIQLGTINITKEQLTDTGTETRTYVLSRQSIDNELKREISYTDDKVNFNFNADVKNSDAGLESNIEMEYSTDQFARIKLETATTIDTNVVEEIPVKFTKENSITLNKYKESQIADLRDIVEKRVIQSLRDSKSKTNTKLLSRIIDKIDDRENSKKAEEIQRKEQKIQEFNNQFELFAGEDLDYENMERLLDAISKNMKDYELMSGRKIRINIEEGSQNEAKFKEVKSAITDRNKYNVDFNYDEEKRIESIDIYLYNKDEN